MPAQGWNSFAGRSLTCPQRLRGQTHRELVYRPLQFQKRSQDFIGANDETLSVAMSIHNPDRSAFHIES